MKDNFDKYIRVAKEAANLAGQFLKKEVGKTHQVKEKGSKANIVTDADVATQNIIVGIIKKNFPNHSILAEEDEMIPEHLSDFIWAIDPIDGTSAFSAGLPTYSSSIGLLQNKKPIVGAIYIAITDEIIWGAFARGAFLDNRKLSILDNKTLSEATVGFDPGYPPREENMSNIATPLSDVVRILPMLYSQATALALITKGILDGYIQSTGPKIWDLAAGKLLVEEAGGVVTDFIGKQIDLFAIKGYVAGTKSVHRQLLRYTTRHLV